MDNRSTASLNDRKISFSDLSISETVLGRGSYGIVKVGKLKGQPVAVKTLSSDAAHIPPVLFGFQRELSLLAHLRHPNIIALLGHCTSSDGCVHLALELAEGGSLDRFLKNNASSIPLTTILGIAVDVAHGVEFLHTRSIPICHRDLKSPNILLGRESSQAKLADFGLARPFCSQAAAAHSSCSAAHMGTVSEGGPLGSIDWMAPENADERHPLYGAPSSDIYSLAVVLYELVRGTGAPPWDGLGATHVLRAVLRGERPAIPRNSPTQLTALIADCWMQNPERRPAAGMVAARLRLLRRELAPSPPVIVPAQHFP